MFLNCSNHKSIFWSEKQLQEARQWGKVVDYPFPRILPDGDEAYINRLAEKIVADIVQMNPKVIMCQGEFTLTYQLVNRLKNQGFTVVAACSDRIAEEQIDESGVTEKNARFQFVRFRKY